MFLKSSRYATTPDATFTGVDGREVRYKTTRFISAVPAQVTSSVGANAWITSPTSTIRARTLLGVL